MTDISKLGTLSREYKNHSVRATSITIMDVEGISGSHIMKVSGHKLKSSLKSYSHFISDQKKREITDTLSSALGQQNDQWIQFLQDLEALSDVFRENFELEPLDVTRSCTTDLQTILCEVDQNQVNTQNQVDAVLIKSSTWFLNFRQHFYNNGNVTIKINFQK